MARFLLLGLLLATALPAQPRDNPCAPPVYVPRMWIDAGGAVGEDAVLAFGHFSPGSPFVLVASPSPNLAPYFPIVTGVVGPGGYTAVRKSVPRNPRLVGQTVYLMSVAWVNNGAQWSHVFEWHVAPSSGPRFARSYPRPSIQFDRGAARAALTDGTFLFSGGWVGWSPPIRRTANAAVLDPSTGVIRGTPIMTTLRAGHAAVALGDGTALVVGGDDPSQAPTAELYDPRTGRFSTLGTVPYRFENPIAERLRHPVTGREFVLLAGGVGMQAPATNQAALYDVAARMFIPIAPMNRPRYRAAAVNLGAGVVLISGGTDHLQAVAADAEVFLLATRSFHPWGSLRAGRWAHSMVALGPTAALVIGGYDQHSSAGLRDLEVFDGLSGRSYPVAFRLHVGRAYVEPAWLQDGSLLISDNSATPERMTASGCTILRPLHDTLPGSVHPLPGGGALAVGEFWAHTVK